MTHSLPPLHWLASTIGKRSYIAHYLKEASPPGSTITGTGNNRFTPGFVACDAAFVLPSIFEAGYCDAVLNVCRQRHINAVITLSDLDLQILPKLRGLLIQQGVHCFFPGHDVALRFVDKFETYQFLNAHGIRTPRTFTNLHEAIDTVGFPIIIKPSYGSASKGMGLFHRRAEAESHWAQVEKPIAQEFVDGRLVNVEACCDTHGRLLAVTAWQRHASHLGETLLAETIDHAAAISLAKDLLSVARIAGPIDIDMIDREGELFLLEVNTRFGGGYPVSHLAGADFTGAMVRSMTGESPTRLDGYRRGVFMMKEIRPFSFESVPLEVL